MTSQLRNAVALNKPIPKSFEGIPDRKILEVAAKYSEEVLQLVGIDLSVIRDNMIEGDEGIHKIGKAIVCNAVRVYYLIKESQIPPAA